jgi:putative membrane protein
MVPVGITFAHPVLGFLVATLTALVFTALNHGFGAAFGPIGKFVALVLIALQVAGAGGTYPIETLPGFFRAIHVFLPMTHAVDLFRGAIGGGWLGPVADVLWLLAWMALALALGLFGAIRTRKAADAGTLAAA